MKTLKTQKRMTNLKTGDTLDMPLVSTTRSLGVAAWYAADRSPSGKGNVIIKIQPGAKGISLSKEKRRVGHIYMYWLILGPIDWIK